MDKSQLNNAADKFLHDVPDGQLDELLLRYLERRFGEAYLNSFDFIGKLPKGYRMIIATYQVEGEVNNGGFSQFFWNHSRHYAAEALEGYKLIGATSQADALEKAMEIFKVEQEAFERFRKRDNYPAWDDFTRTNQFSEAFYNAEAELSVFRGRWIRRHAEEFLINDTLIAQPRDGTSVPGKSGVSKK